MPHAKPWRLGAMVVFAFSGAVLAAAAVLARASGELDSTDIRRTLGLEARPFGLVSDTEVRLTAVAAPRNFVAGRILDAEGNGVAGSAVRVRSEARPGCDWVTSSGSDGSFQVDGVAPGRVYVAAHDIAAGLVESMPLGVEEAHHVVLVLDRTVEISGTVLDERGGSIARAVVKIGASTGEPDRIVIADEDGRFTLRTSSRSSDRITVWARGFQVTTSAIGPVTSDVIRRDVRLRSSPKVRGAIVDPAGEVVRGARISACAGRQAEVATSDAAGIFELPATAVGCWVSASHPRFASSRPMRIASGRPLLVRLGAGGAIEGDAVDEHGRPIALFSVTIASFEPEDGVPGTASREGETAEHLRGTFSIDDLAPGKYVLRLSAEGKTDVDSRTIEVGRGRVVRGEHLVLVSSDVPASEEGEAEPVSGAESRDEVTPAESSAPNDADPPTEGPPTSGED